MNTISYITKPIKTCISRFKKLHIVVFGDVILDAYHRGEVKRVSPEAPVPILLRTEKDDYRLGGGGNVAYNLVKMGVKVTLSSVIGKDKNGRIVLDHLKKDKISAVGVLVTSKRKTSVKTRIIAQSQQIVRIDEEDTNEIQDSINKNIIDRIKKIPQPINGIIISDYGKGVVNHRSFKWLLEFARTQNIFLALDPKQNNFSFYKDVDVMTPNHFEAAEDIGRRCETLNEVKSVGLEMTNKYSLRHLLITRGEKGMTLFDNSSFSLKSLVHEIKTKRKIQSKKPRIYNLPTFNRSLFDVSGAGDTVIALYTASYLVSRDAYLSALIANISAGIVVSYFGTSPVTLKDFLMEIDNKLLMKKVLQGKHHES